jgi:hypothetical protein
MFLTLLNDAASAFTKQCTNLITIGTSKIFSDIYSFWLYLCVQWESVAHGISLYALLNAARLSGESISRNKVFSESILIMTKYSTNFCKRNYKILLNLWGWKITFKNIINKHKLIARNIVTSNGCNFILHTTKCFNILMTILWNFNFNSHNLSTCVT